MNKKLKALFEEDQQDLRTLPGDRVERDRVRRKQVQDMIVNGELMEAIDYIHAAIIFQHGESLDDWWQAYELSVRAVELGFQPKWLAAVAFDRWLLRQGKPLKYGNQVVPFGGVYRIPKLDPSTTDEECAEWDVPSVNDLLAFRNLRGFMNAETIDSLIASELRVSVVELERHPVHSPYLKGIPCGETARNKTIYENSYGWKWVEGEEASFRLGWLQLPRVPEVAHAVADNQGTAEMELMEIKGRGAISVKYHNSVTIYIGGDEDGIWSVTGMAADEVLEKAVELIGGS